uniref:Uncharacterized protein n=1 Tax=Plectus sambesii TaxID=2011161 RepID=A0A914VX56_9BILA
MVFLQNGTDDSKVLAINNRNAFFNYQYFMVFINAPLGLFSCLMRIVKATAFGLWSLPRLDGSTLSRRFEQYDNGYGAYVSLLHLENSVNNPVVVVFINLLMESQKKRISRSIQASAFRLEKSLTFFDSKSLFSNRRVIRNRWHLYVTLINNPALRTSRRTRLDVPTMVNRMIQTAAGLHDYLLDDWHYQGYDNPSWHM